MSGVGNVGVWVREWYGSNFGVGDVGGEGWNFGVRGVGQKKGVSGMGRNFGVGGVGLRCFVKKVLLKVPQNLQESTCAGVSC